jgi:radical SAM-linked protein
MLNAKFRKTDEAVFISHIDVQNAINRSIRRAGYEPRLSGGFNPHTMLKLSSPLPLGVASEAEYFTLYLDGVAPEVFAARFNDNSPGGLKVISVFESERNPNLAGNAVASDYLIGVKGLDMRAQELRQLIQNGFIVKHKTKDGVTEKEVRDLIYSVLPHPAGLLVRLASGNTTLRPDRFAEAAGRLLGVDIPVSSVLRTAQYVMAEGELVNADEYLKKFAKTAI